MHKNKIFYRQLVVRFTNKSYVLPQTGQVHSCFNSCFDRRYYRSLRTMFLSELFLATSKPFHVLQSSQQKRLFSKPHLLGCFQTHSSAQGLLRAKDLVAETHLFGLSGHADLRLRLGTWQWKISNFAQVCLKMGYTTYPQMAILMGNMIIIQWLLRVYYFQTNPGRLSKSV